MSSARSPKHEKAVRMVQQSERETAECKTNIGGLEMAEARLEAKMLGPEALAYSVTGKPAAAIVPEICLRGESSNLSLTVEIESRHRRKD